MQTEICLALQGVLRFGRMKDEGTDTPEITSIMKRNSSGKALEIARMARDMLGGNGISDEFAIARHMVNLEVVIPTRGRTTFMRWCSGGHRRESRPSRDGNSGVLELTDLRKQRRGGPGRARPGCVVAVLRPPLAGDGRTRPAELSATCASPNARRDLRTWRTSFSRFPRGRDRHACRPGPGIVTKEILVGLHRDLFP